MAVARRMLSTAPKSAAPRAAPRAAAAGVPVPAPAAAAAARASAQSPQTLTSPPAPAPRSIVQHPVSLTDRPLELGQPSAKEDLFAVVNFSGTQYKVVLDDTIVADRIEGVDIGQKLDLDQVLLLGSRKATIVGRPTINNAAVVVEVEEIAKDKKVVTLKTRRRKNSRSLRGFRREVTVLRVVDFKTDPTDSAAL